MMLRYDEIDSPVGRLALAVGPSGVCALEFLDRSDRVRKHLEARFPSFELRRADDPEGYSTRLRAYFAGELNALDDIAVEARPIIPPSQPDQNREDALSALVNLGYSSKESEKLLSQVDFSDDPDLETILTRVLRSAAR